MGLHDEAERGLWEWWEAHPDAYLKMREEQMARCLDAKGKVMKKHRRAYEYYKLQKWLFEFPRTILKGE